MVNTHKLLSISFIFNYCMLKLVYGLDCESQISTHSGRAFNHQYNVWYNKQFSFT